MSDQKEMCRLFVGTFLAPDQQESLGALALQAERLKQSWQGKIRFVKAAKLHLTWLFLGSVSREVIPHMVEDMAELTKSIQGFSLSYDKAVFWPNNRKPRQLVLVSSTAHKEALALAKNINHKLIKYMTQADTRSFNPHITLLRLEADYIYPELAIPDWFEIDKLLPLRQQIDKILLIESHLGGGQDEYVPLSTLSLYDNHNASVS